MNKVGTLGIGWTVWLSMYAGAGLAAAHPDSVVPERDPVRLVEHAERYAPSIVPDRIVLTWAGDPKTTQAVTWRTSMDVLHGIAEIAEAGHGPDFKDAARRTLAVTRTFSSDLHRYQVHSVNFRDLRPGTMYAYRVGDGVNWSEWYQFTTEPAEREPFTFVYFGDAQNDVRRMWSRVTREAFRDAPRAAFFLHAGDLVNRADSDGEWGEWFEAGSFINAMIPVIATPGNHEYVKRDGPDGERIRTLTEHFPVVFAFPENGPSELRSTVYYIDYGDLRVISLNSNERQAEQVTWLDRVLEENDRRWTVVTFHHPIFSMGRDRDNAALRALWKPVFDRHAVDMVLNGHDHTYGRTEVVGEGGMPVPMENAEGGLSKRSEAGTVYVVSVSGPKMYNAKADVGVPLARRAEDTQLYQVITVDGDELRYEARTAIGALYDAFTLRQRDGKRNELIERPMTMAPRRR